ncbi:MAG: glycosyltransferase [Clostridia bacterium]|nr:glycosyltransferase [Clostridia bacterium]
MKKISVIVPVYNVEKYIEKCLDSIINQTYKNLEIILIDDGSTDNSCRICDEYALRDERFTVVHNENGGVSVARNAGLKKATGEYIMFVDSDDYVESDIAEVLMNLTLQYDADISMCSFKYADTDGNTRNQTDLAVAEGCISGDEFWQCFYSGGRTIGVTLWAKLYKRSLWQDIHFPDGKLHEDEFVTHSLVKKCKNIAVTKKPLYYYVQREGSIMNTQFMTQNFDAAEGILVRCRYFYEQKEFDNAAKSLTMAMYNIIRGLNLLEKPTENDKKRLKQLKKEFRSLYRKLFFKKTDFFSKLKCGVYYLNTKLFTLLKKG